MFHIHNDWHNEILYVKIMQGKQIHDLQFLQLFNSCLMDLIMSTENMQFKLIWILNMIFNLIDKKCIKSEFKRFISVSVIYKKCFKHFKYTTTKVRFSIKCVRISLKLSLTIIIYVTEVYLIYCKMNLSFATQKCSDLY